MFYKNTSYFEKTFYGVTFKPGEIKEVDRRINDRFMIVVPAPKADNTELQQKPSSEKPKEDSHKSSKSKDSSKDKKDIIKTEDVVEETA